MAYNFCTLFDSNYLHKGLALYLSLEDLGVDFHLYVLAFDDQCYTTLSTLKLPKLSIISLKEFETEDLLAVKPNRSRAEYCWTSTASLIYHCITKFSLDSCTYVDADLMFYNSPQSVFEEISQYSVAITKHEPDGIDRIEGKYCVQFNYFKNDEHGMAALKWWKDSCIEWCFSRYEEGKFGDQKYLDYFTEKFSNVKVIEHLGVGVAPWNIKYFDFQNFGKIKYKESLQDIIFFHYHGTRIEVVDYQISVYLIDSDSDPNLEKNIYLPYIKLLGRVYSQYLDYKITKYKVYSRSIFSRYFAKVKFSLRENKLVRFLYYNIFRNN